MDGASLNGSSFRTPARILIPKLAASRDGWKGKASERKRRLKAAHIRIRDLEASRARWHERASEAEGQAGKRDRQLEQTRQALAAANAEIARLRDEKKS